jgi:hypothetical protein
MKNTILAAAVLAATIFGLGTASAAQITLSGGVGFDQFSGGTPAVGMLGVAAPAREPISGLPLRLHANAIVGLRSTDAVQTAAFGTLYLPTTSGPREIDLAAGYSEDFGRLRLEPGLDIGHASVLGQSDSHGAYQLRGGYSLGNGLALDGQARVGVASGGQLYAGADVGLSVANVAHGTVTASYQFLRDGTLPRQEIVSVSYQHALRF